MNLNLGFLQFFNLSASYSFVILNNIIKLKIKKKNHKTLYNIEVISFLY